MPKYQLELLFPFIEFPSSDLLSTVSMLAEVFRKLEPFLAWILEIPKLWPNILPRVKLTLSFLLGIGALRKVNNLLSQLSLNNFCRDSYDWRKEVVLVTGGSGGLGDLLVRKLAKLCIKVISLDITPPKTPLRQ